MGKNLYHLLYCAEKFEFFIQVNSGLIEHHFPRKQGGTSMTNPGSIMTISDSYASTNTKQTSQWKTDFTIS